MIFFIAGTPVGFSILKKEKQVAYRLSFFQY